MADEKGGSQPPYRVEFVRDDGSDDVVETGGDRSLLEIADRNAIDMRHGCREGKCVSCTGRLLAGEVSYRTEPEALTDRLRRSGFVLLCVAAPVSDCRIEIGQSVLAAAFPGLWSSEGYTGVPQLERARTELTRLEATELDTGELDYLEGSLEPYENLQKIKAAYWNVRKANDGRHDT
ncbi:ferredoxin [Halalkaliarchaeum desulfuricum]|uniref:Ferredoxin n=1 Tax=Halalkaliarchaeum desulfuricum TaxID=2055893 RepID=A0A343THC2_9EURY|nr:2Fe-2S iron-sulfur cluster-binding protein [Halalkaliarchaeum desulfuricum]AUX08494.1 ferredoxin [Halalkaliarchaeum desulfuricum]